MIVIRSQLILELPAEKAPTMDLHLCHYSQLLNESTGTLKKNSLKIQAVLYFFCGTIEGNSKIRVVVLLFQRYYWEIFIKLQKKN